MKNKEIEELLNNLKSVYELNKPLTDKYKEDCMRFVINTKEAELLLSYIEQLETNRDKARKMIFDNYGVLDKYGIEMLDDILKGDSDE